MQLAHTVERIALIHQVCYPNDYSANGTPISEFPIDYKRLKELIQVLHMPFSVIAPPKTPFERVLKPSPAFAIGWGS